MAADVLWMSNHRAVFVLPYSQGASAFLATRGKPPRIAHEQPFASVPEAMSYARDLSSRFGCSIIAPTAGNAIGEDAAHG